MIKNYFGELVIGVDIGGSKISAGIVDSAGKLIDFASTRIGENSATDTTVASIARLLSANEISLKDIGAIVLGIPGVVNAGEGTVLSCPNLKEIEGDQFVQTIWTHYPVDIYLQNDVNLAALGEQWFGAARGYRNLVVVYVGTGIGTGIVIDGRLLRGSHGWAGEMGHTVISVGGPLCGCGNRGCFETLASGSAIARRARENGFDPADLKQLVESGDERAITVLEESRKYLAVGIANIINIFDPEIVLIGGGVAQLEGVLFDGLIPEVLSMVRPLYREHVQIAPAKLNYLAPILGSAALYRDPESEPARRCSGFES